MAGGGAVGLAAALGLKRAGIDVALVGAVRDPRDDGRTAALMAPSVKILEGVGAMERLEPKAAPLAAMRLIDLTGGLVRAPTVTFRASELDLSWFALNIANADLVREMTAEFEAIGGQAYAGLVEQAAFGPDSARLALSDGEAVSARLVIGADGWKSTLRSSAGIEIRNWSYDQVALTFHVRHTKDHEDISTELHLRAGPLTFVPVQPFRCAVVWLVRPEEADRLRALEGNGLAIAAQRASSSLLGNLTPLTGVAGVPMRGLVAKRATAPRLMLAGEALHAFPPIGAQGLNLGLRDARDAARTVKDALSKGEDPGGAAALARYERDRRFDAVSRTLGVDLLNRSLFSGLLPVDALRAGALAAAANFGPIRRFLMRSGMGESPLAALRG